MPSARFLTSEDVNGLATAAEYVDAVREGYRQRGEGAPAEPRTALFSDDPPGKFTGYFAVLPETGAMGAYVYAGGFESRDAYFTLPLYDARSGKPLAVLDGASMNPYKTGATGAVAVDELAREDAETVGVFGSGRQAMGQIRAVEAVRDVDAVRVFSPTESHREEFATAADAHLDAAVAAVDGPRAAVEGSDVVITATDADEPVFEGEWLEPGTHVTALGQYHPEKREIDAATVRQATYVLDLLGRETQDSGALIQAKADGAIGDDHVHAELGEVVAGHAPGRTSDEELTVFDSGGTGIETVAAAHMLYERARERGLGSEVSYAAASETF